MSQQEVLEIGIDAGEDFAAQIFWTDEDGTAVPVAAPALMEVRDTLNALVMSFSSANAGSTSTLAAISVTGASGLIQLSAPKVITKLLTTGRYRFDLWATSAAAAQPFANQLQKVADGWVVVEGSTSNTVGM